MDKLERPPYLILTSEEGIKTFDKCCEEYLNNRSFVLYPGPKLELDIKNAAIKLNEKLNQKINS